jgi:hypothetical protein
MCIEGSAGVGICMNIYEIATEIIQLWLFESSCFHQGAIAKWLRREFRKLLLFEGAGSSPAGVAFCFLGVSCGVMIFSSVMDFSTLHVEYVFISVQNIRNILSGVS